MMKLVIKDLTLITDLDTNNSYEDILNNDNNTFSNIAITAYSRIEIYKYKIIPDNECYYTNTNSVFL